jgi:hypothetical protein
MGSSDLKKKNLCGNRTSARERSEESHDNTSKHFLGFIKLPAAVEKRPNGFLRLTKLK